MQSDSVYRCPRCRAEGGRHVAGCALAPPMYIEASGIPVARVLREYHGDADEDGVPGLCDD